MLNSATCEAKENHAKTNYLSLIIDEFTLLGAAANLRCSFQHLRELRYQARFFADSETDLVPTQSPP